MAQIRRAIVSVTNKTGVVDFCKVLTSLGVEILSTGGTAKVLKGACLPVQEVSDYTGSPEVLDGRLKTLHPKIEGGILGIRDNPQHVKEMESLGIGPIDLVVVNLYEFEKAAAKENLPLDELIEQIDIGGPTMLRAAAKNYKYVTVVVNPADYPLVAKEMLENKGGVSLKTNFELAVKVFQKTAQYDSLIAETLYPLLGESEFPKILNLSWNKIQDLRYGENPHQKGAFYRQPLSPPGTLATAHQLHGKGLSYNNILDCDAALSCIAEFTEPACAIIKHTNPCGAAVANNLKEAFVRAREGDPLSSFGGIIAVNKSLDGETAKAIGDTFFECILAPDYEKEALDLLKSKKNLRLISICSINKFKESDYEYRCVSGGLLVQEKDVASVDLVCSLVPTKLKPTPDQLEELTFAWKLVKHVKSNAIVFTKGKQLLGVGAGQMSRVDSVKIAGMKAVLSLEGGVMASDAFFPFRDGIDEAAKLGIKSVVQPGGSVKDPEVIAACDEHGMNMVFTGMRHFKH